MRTIYACVACLLIAMGPSATVSAQSLGSVIKKAAEKETKRQAERRTREAVQCATGARDCLPATPAKQQAAQPAPAPADTPASRTSSPSTDAADAYLIPSGAASSGASATSASPFVVAAMAGAVAVEQSGPAQSSYRRITGFAPKLLSFQDQSGLLTRTRYEIAGKQTSSAVLAGFQGPLAAQGFTTQWQCTRRQQCGSSSYHQLGAGYPPVNGINLGIGGDVSYWTGKLVRSGLPTVYVSIATNPKLAFVDIIEVAE